MYIETKSNQWNVKKVYSTKDKNDVSSKNSCICPSKEPNRELLKT